MSSFRYCRHCNHIHTSTLPSPTAAGAWLLLILLVQVRPRALPALRPSEQKVEEPEDDNNTLSLDPRRQLYSLYFLTSKLFSEPKVVVNSRVIVVGASDTGLSFLQSLCLVSCRCCSPREDGQLTLSLPLLLLFFPPLLLFLPQVPYLKFTHLTLVSPNGLPPHTPTTLPQRLRSVPGNEASTTIQYNPKHYWPAQPSLSPAPFLPLPEFSPALLSQLNLSSRVRVVAGAVTEIDRESNALILSDGSLLPYDQVVLTPGLSEPTVRVQLLLMTMTNRA